MGTVSSLGYLGQVNRQKVEKRLVDLLEAPTASVRIMAASALNLIDGPLDRAIQVLIEVAVTTPKIWPLRDGKRMYAEGDASYAISTLGSLGERAAICVPTLIELLKSEDMGVHINSIDALGQIGIAASIAVPALEKELLDSESFFHPWGPRGGDYASAHAAKALGLIGRTAFPVLDDALSHPEPAIRARAADAMGTILEKESANFPNAATRLLPLLTDSDSKIRAAATKALGNLPQSANMLFEPLTRLLSDSQSNVRIEAIIALGKLPLPADMLFELISRLVMDEQPTVRIEAVSTLGKLPQSANTIDTMSRLLSNSDPSVRIEAMIALGKLGPLANTTAPKLVPLLFDKSVHLYDDGQLCNFRSRLVSEAAYRALLSMQSKADQVVPGLVVAFQQGLTPTDQCILMLREFKTEAHAAKEPLELYLTNEQPLIGNRAEFLEQGQEDDPQWLAACGLAMIDPHNPKIRPILEPLFFEGIYSLNRSDHLALIEMISAGVEFDAEFRRLLECANEHDVPAFWVCQLQWEPDNQRAVKALLSSLAWSQSESERALRNLFHHLPVQQVLLDTVRDPSILQLTRERAALILQDAKAVRGKQ